MSVLFSPALSFLPFILNLFLQGPYLNSLEASATVARSRAASVHPRVVVIHHSTYMFRFSSTNFPNNNNINNKFKKYCRHYDVSNLYAPFLCRTQPNPLFAEEESADEETNQEPEWKKRKI